MELSTSAKPSFSFIWTLISFQLADMASVTLVLVMGMMVLAKAEQLKEGGVLVLTDDNFDQVGCCLMLLRCS